MLELGFGLTFHDLYSCAGLRRVDAAFGAWIEHADAALAARLAAARADPAALTRLQESEFLIALAPHLEDWLALLFGIEREVAALVDEDEDRDEDDEVEEVHGEGPRSV